MASIIKLTGPIGKFTVAYSGGGCLLKICRSRVGAYSRGGLFRGEGGNSFNLSKICSY